MQSSISLAASAVRTLYGPCERAGDIKGEFYNLRFGGSQVGWIGEMSVPMTYDSG